MEPGEPKFEEQKRETPVSKIVGGTEDQRQELLVKHQKMFFETEGKFYHFSFSDIPLETIEKEKEDRDVKIIDFVLKRMPDFIKEYGGTPVAVELEQVHLLDKKKFPKNKLKDTKGTGFFHLSDESLTVLYSHGKLEMARSLVHELIHLNSFNSLNAVQDLEFETPLGDRRRTGLAMDSQESIRDHFDWLDEALTEELTKRFDDEFLKDSPLFRKAKKNSNTGFYREAIKSMNILIDDLHEKNQLRFKNREEIFRLMVDGKMTGKVLDFARLIESTYGKGSFRKLASSRKSVAGIIGARYSL